MNIMHAILVFLLYRARFILYAIFALIAFLIMIALMPDSTTRFKVFSMTDEPACQFTRQEPNCYRKINTDRGEMRIKERDVAKIRIGSKCTARVYGLFGDMDAEIIRCDRKPFN